MSLVDVILERRSVRNYTDRKIPEEIVGRILEAGRQAPSADNVQPWHFIVVTDDEIKRKLSLGKYSTFIKYSAFIVIGCGYVGNADGRKWSTVDTSIALQNMVIAAWAQGVGSCWVGDFQEAEIKQLLKIPHDWKVIAFISFGYPAEYPATKSKKPMDEIVSYNEF